MNVIQNKQWHNASIPTTTPDAFAKLAEEARSGCLMSRLLNTKVTMDAELTIK